MVTQYQTVIPFAASVALGVMVDDTIHYVHRYLEELRHGSGEKAVERCHVSVGYALLYTLLIVILGFSLLAFSDFVPSILFCLLTGLAMAMAVLFDLSICRCCSKKLSLNPDCRPPCFTWRGRNVTNRKKFKETFI